ncbi:hypothetical protein BGX31_007783 [Mortierella sp. GBA43]|nr:hypothetical protein BGX31_007783 [Mortierella sp. GBA43]
MWALDVEWKPYFGRGEQGPISLVQLGDDTTLYLFHVHYMKKFPSELTRILTHEHILKVGVNIKGDGTKLMKDWGVKCSNLVELGSICIQVLHDLPNKRKIRSMESLTRELFGHTVDKEPSLRMADWSRSRLHMNQVAYAANDVFVTYEIAAKIKQLQKAHPSRDYHVELSTIKSGGADVVAVLGTLQGCEDNLHRMATRSEPTNTSAVSPPKRSDERPVKEKYLETIQTPIFE